MITYDLTCKNEQKLQQLTSLNSGEFLYLLTHFAPICESYFKYKTYEGKKRLLPRFKPQANEQLPTSQDKLFFILVNLKSNTLQQIQAALFSMSQARVSSWIKTLQPLLDQTLIKLKLTPTYDTERLLQHLRAHPDHIFTHDATERPVARKVESDAQREEYSGKKKSHTIKNEILVDDAGQILYASPTYEGKMHDKALCDDVGLLLPQGSQLRQDAGYQGYAPVGVTIIQPMKKPRGKDLTAEQKEKNQAISKKRVVVEHSLAGVKRLRTVKEQLRSRCYEIRDCVFRIACALHNLRVKSPFRAYAPRTQVWAL